METVLSFIDNNLIPLTANAFIMIIFVCFSIIKSKESALLGVSVGLFAMFAMAICLINLIILEARPILPNPITGGVDGLFKIATRFFVIGVPIAFLFFLIFMDDRRAK